jgi:hypothetical protein
MESMDRLTPEIARLIKAKEQRRLRLAALPFPEKARVVVEMQRMAAPILRERGHVVCVWDVRGA